MFRWLHHLLNPHCEHCKEERADDKVCQSCEVLRHQLEVANQQIDKLVNKITEKPEPPVINNTPPVLTRPKMVPWAVKRQMLEAEDRAKAIAMRNSAKPDDAVAKEDVAELEKELDLAAEARATESNSSTDTGTTG